MRSSYHLSFSLANAAFLGFVDLPTNNPATMPKTTLITTMHPSVKAKCSGALEIGSRKRVQKNKASKTLAPQREPPVNIRLNLRDGNCRK